MYNVQRVQHEGKSEKKERQEKPHAHKVVFHPKDNKIFINDLGTDAIESIPFSSDTKGFLQTDRVVSVQLPAGSESRHLVFTKDVLKAFATFELNNELGFLNIKISN